VVILCNTRFNVKEFFVLRAQFGYVFVRYAEHTAIILLQSINSLVFITQRHCVYCVVRTEYLNTIQINRLVADLSSRRTIFDAGSVFVRFLVEKVALGQVFIRVLRFYPVSRVPPCLFLYTYCSYRKDNWAKLENLPKSNAFSETGEHCTEKYFQLFYKRIIHHFPTI
jgi:hypothetical protein